MHVHEELRDVLHVLMLDTLGKKTEPQRRAGGEMETCTRGLKLPLSLGSNSWYTFHQIISFSVQLGPFYLASAKLTRPTRFCLRKC